MDDAFGGGSSSFVISRHAGRSRTFLKDPARGIEPQHGAAIWADLVRYVGPLPIWVQREMPGIGSFCSPINSGSWGVKVALDASSRYR